MVYIVMAYIVMAYIVMAPVGAISFSSFARVASSISSAACLTYK